LHVPPCIPHIIAERHTPLVPLLLLLLPVPPTTQQHGVIVPTQVLAPKHGVPTVGLQTPAPSQTPLVHDVPMVAGKYWQVLFMQKAV
jgi:hypothetical protein